MARSELDERRVHLDTLSVHAAQAERASDLLQACIPVIAHRPKLVERIQNFFVLCHSVECYSKNVSPFQNPDRRQEIERGDHLVCRLTQVMCNVSCFEPHSRAVAKEIERFTAACTVYDVPSDRTGGGCNLVI